MSEVALERALEPGERVLWQRRPSGWPSLLWPILVGIVTTLAMAWLWWTVIALDEGIAYREGIPRTTRAGLLALDCGDGLFIPNPLLVGVAIGAAFHSSSARDFVPVHTR